MFSLILQHIQELFRYRSLVNSLVIRELKARYRGSFLGFLWTFLNPLLLLGVYALVFNFYLRIRVEHYAGFMFVGLLPWIWFSSFFVGGNQFDYRRRQLGYQGPLSQSGPAGS